MPRKTPNSQQVEEAALEPTQTSESQSVETAPEAGASSSSSSYAQEGAPDNDNGGSSSNSSISARLQKLKDLKKKMEETQQANRQDVYAEHQHKKSNKKEIVRVDKKREQAEALLKEELAAEAGLDLERVRALGYTAEDVERWEEKQREKAERANVGFTDYAQAAAKKYFRLTKELKPNMNEYLEQKHSSDSSDFYRDADSLAYAAPDDVPSRPAVDRMVKDLEKQLEQRAKYSKRRPHDEEDDVTYINERNMRFNKKIARAYDRYTAEIKASFERGTALD
ncbi:pre-mRNA-splicing factor syf2 [Quaeritorhiza haematococci]|nr:pre-mRNA-splicing factor syf2 [Quaeritorhiza haematococci]